MTPIYKFYLERVSDDYSLENNERVIANPIYKNDLSIKYQKESGEQFFRRSLEGKLTFVRYDYDFIMATFFDTIIKVIIEKSNDNGKTYEPYYIGKFLRTDCTIDESNKSVTVQPDVIDEYTDILAGIENEYNLLNLAPRIDRFLQYVRPVLQFYVEGTEIIQNYIGGVFYESDAKVVTGTDIANVYHFALHYVDEVVLQFTPSPGNDLHMEGTYRGYISYVGNELQGNLYPDTPTGHHIIYKLNADGINGSFRIYDETRQMEVGGSLDLHTEQIFYYVREQEHPEEHAQPIYDIYTVTYFPYAKIYARYLLNRGDYRGQATYPIPIDDISGDNKNYQYCIGFAGMSGMRSTRNEVDFPTKWGIKPNGKYYQIPDTIYTYYPLARSLWGEKSYWFYEYIGYQDMEASGRTPKMMPDTYTIESVISVLLKEVTGGKINFYESAQCSQYMFGAIRPERWHLFTTPISNVLAGDYTVPAQKAPITLRSVLDFLKKAYGMYWHIEGNLLHIEHITYYKNGGSYTTMPTVGTDLTTLKNTRNGKELAFDTSNYTFNKSDMTSRFEYGWANDVSEPFKGEAIDVLANYVQKGKVDKINISDFTSDVDIMNINPSAMSLDGFAIFETRYIDNVWTCPIVDLQIGRTAYHLNNGYLAMYYLQPTHLISDMPAESLMVNGRYETAQGVMKGKEQTINFPCGENDPDTLKLIKTHLGAGQIKTIQINLTSRNAKATLIYETN